MEDKRMNIYEKLMNIQQELKAPKGQYNSFGKYKYRNCEDILESVKPLLAKYKVILKLSDELCYIGERYYVKASANLIDIESNDSIQNTAFAREEESKKGMDGSQITGASSSYARKYALNGLFAIDDTKDSDTTNIGNASDSKSNKKATSKQIEVIRKKLEYEGNEEEGEASILKHYGISKLEDLSMEQASELVERALKK